MRNTRLPINRHASVSRHCQESSQKLQEARLLSEIAIDTEKRSSVPHNQEQERGIDLPSTMLDPWLSLGRSTAKEDSLQLPQTQFKRAWHVHARLTRKEQVVSLSTALHESRLPEQKSSQKELVPEASAELREHRAVLCSAKDQEWELKLSKPCKKSALHYDELYMATGNCHEKPKLKRTQYESVAESHS